jgi:conjugal transfer mating pair stabilization protein TraN
MKKLLLMPYFFLASFNVFSGDCVKTGVTCVNTSGSVCIEYRDDYTCIKPNAVNYCSPFEAIAPQCWQTSTTCTQTDTLLGTGCMEYSKTFQCNNPVSPAPSNTVTLAETYTLVSSNYNTTPCATPANDPNCQLAQSTCISTTPPTLPSSILASSVAPDGCFQRENKYACVSPSFYSDCAAFANDPNCTLLSSGVPPGAGTVNSSTTMTSRRYSCVSKPATTSTVSNCDGQAYCVDGNCFDSSHPADTDMVKTATMMEAAREAGKYLDPNSMKLFNGVNEKCTRKLLKNCCNEGSVSKSNNSVVATMGFTIGKWLGNGVYESASNYAYDFMYNNGIFKDFAFDGLSSLASSGAAAANFSQVGNFYGLSVWSGAATTVPAMGSSITGATVSSMGSVGGFQFGFDPYSLAISLAIQVIMQMMSCDEADIYAATHNKSGLCTYVGDYCSQDVLIIGCIEWKNSYCCYNSKLAKIVNDQGRPLIGKGYGSAKSPDCSGFTTAEFQQIDFNQLDLSSFYSEIIPRNLSSFGSEINTQMGTRINEQVQQAAP